jgi:hypothetical protein
MTNDAADDSRDLRKFSLRGAGLRVQSRFVKFTHVESDEMGTLPPFECVGADSASARTVPEQVMVVDCRARECPNTTAKTRTPLNKHFADLIGSRSMAARFGAPLGRQAATEAARRLLSDQTYEDC